MSSTIVADNPQVVNLDWPEAIRTPHVEFLVRNLASLGAWVEVGPTTHARNWNTLHLPDGVTYTTHGAGPWWTLDECHCVTDSQSCPACRAAARHTYRDEVAS